MPVLEVIGPDRSQRRAAGKDDALDAIAAARAALTGQRVQVAKERSDAVEALRASAHDAQDGGALAPGRSAAAS